MKKKIRIGMIMIVLLLAIALMASGCTQGQSGSESKQQEPSEQQNPPEDVEDKDEQNIEEIVSVNRVSTDSLTLLCSAEADFDKDGSEEEIELYTSAKKDSDGNIMWDDGQRWLLLVRKSDRDFVLYDDYIQLGNLEFWLYSEEDGEGEYHISTIRPSSGGLFFSDYTYDVEKNVFIKKDIFQASGINLKFSSGYYYK